MDTSRKTTIRITVVGDGATGKTSMLIAYKDKKFDDRYQPTVFDSYSMTIEINSVAYTVILADTAGQEEFDKLRRFAYKDVDCFILTYAVNERNSFENVYHKWAPELRRFSPKAKIVLAATKMDLKRGTSSHVTSEEGEMLARDINAYGFIENSSKNMSFIEATFQMAISVALFDKNYLKVKKPPLCTCL